MSQNIYEYLCIKETESTELRLYPLKRSTVHLEMRLHTKYFILAKHHTIVVEYQIGSFIINH